MVPAVAGVPPRITPLKLSANVSAAAIRALKNERCFANINTPSDGIARSGKAPLVSL
jgi:hypothetical protein